LGRFFVPPNTNDKSIIYPFKYLYYFVGATLSFKRFVRHCIPSSVYLASVFMINIPTFSSKNKCKAVLYFDSDRLEMYAYNTAIGEDDIDLYWSDRSLINTLLENSNKEGRKAISKFFKFKTISTLRPTLLSEQY
jgi:hypothetical protein